MAAERQRILVTGADGFVGRWPVARLSTALPLADVLATGRRAAFALDVTRDEDVDASVSRTRPTAVIHLAGMSSPVKARAETRAAWSVNLFGTMNLAEAVLHHAPEARFIHAGQSRGRAMKAVRIYEYGGPEVLKYELDVSEPAVSPDDILVEVAAASVNPIDWKVRSGARQKDFPLKLPAILGRDVSGIVRAVGANVRTLKPGDRVIAMAGATYAQYVALPAAVATHLPDGVDLVDAAAIPLVSLTGEQLVRIATQAVAGQTILVTGALGSVGRAAVHAAKKLGAEVVAGVRARQVGEAEGLGASSVLALDDEDAVARLGAVDGVADTVGGEVAARLVGKVKDGGRFGYASVLPDGIAARYPSLVVTRVFARPDPSKVREFADDIRDGRFALPISRRLPLQDVGAAHASLEKGGGGKVVLRP